MTARGYCDAEAVGAYLGVTLTAAQAAQAAALVEAAEQVVDAYTGVAWLTGPVTEHYVAAGPLLYLRQRPITSVQSVTGRWALGGSGTVLTAGTEYEVQDASRGLLYVAPWRSYGELVVAYTPASTVPAAVRQATAMLVAHCLGPHLDGMTSEVASYSVFGQVSVQLREAGLLPDAKLLLAPYRRTVLA